MSRAKHDCTSCLSAAQLPKTVRPIKWVSPGGRVKLCATCFRRRNKEKKTNSRSTYETRQYGIPQEDQAELWEYQKGRCPCGRKPTRAPDVDHDHKCCPTPPTCGLCTNGYACRQCNQVLMGRYTSAQLRAVADFMDDPPYPRMLRERRERDG